MNTAYNTSKEHKEQTRSTRSTQYEEEHEYRLNYKRRAHKEQTRSTRNRQGAQAEHSVQGAQGVGLWERWRLHVSLKQPRSLAPSSPGPGVMSLSKHPLSV